MKALVMVFVGGLFVLACDQHAETRLYGTVVDPENFLYARFGLLDLMMGKEHEEGTACYNEACSGVEAVAAAAVADVPVGTLEEPSSLSSPSDTSGDFQLVVSGEEIHPMTRPGENSGYASTIDGNGIHLGHGDVRGYMAPVCPTNSPMMSIIPREVFDGGAATVVITDGNGLDFELVTENLSIEVDDEKGSADLAFFGLQFDENSVPTGWVMAASQEDLEKQDAHFMGIVAAYNISGEPSLLIEETAKEGKKGKKTEHHKVAEFAPVLLWAPAGMLVMNMVGPISDESSESGGHGGH